MAPQTADKGWLTIACNIIEPSLPDLAQTTNVGILQDRLQAHALASLQNLQ